MSHSLGYGRSGWRVECRRWGRLSCLSGSRLLPSWLLYTPRRWRTAILSNRWDLGWQLPLDGGADWELGSTVNQDGVVQIVILEAVIIFVVALGRVELMRLGELDGIVLQLLEGRIVEFVEVIVVKFVHLSIGPMPRLRGGELRLGCVLCSKWVVPSCRRH